MTKAIIIGTGIVGALTSYELVRRGVDVVMIDAKMSGRATSAAAGLINPWSTKRRNKAWYELATKGAALYPIIIKQLEEDGETDTGFKQTGAIHLHDDEQKLLELYEIVANRKKTIPEIGEITLLDEVTIQQKYPLLAQGYQGLFISGASLVDGHLLTNALTRATIKRGAQKIIGPAKLWVTNEKVHGVTVNDEKIEADVTIATNGIWMKQLLANIEIDVNITVQKGQIIHLQTTNFIDDMPVFISPNNKYILPFLNGKIIIGTSFHRVAIDEADTSISVGATYQMLHGVIQCIPSLQDATIIRSKVGFRPYTPDHLPLFGKFPNMENLYVANGLGASGLSTGPMIARQLAKMITQEALDIVPEKYSVTNMIK